MIKVNVKTAMKNIILVLLITLGITTAEAQTPVSWNFTTKKVDSKTYELHLTAVLQSGWHLFSQTQPDDAIAVPTGIVTAEIARANKPWTTEVCPNCHAEGHDADAVHCKYCGEKL